jgi:hypothetical protein
MKGASWVNLVLGIWLVFAPWALQFAGAAAANSVIFGFLVLIVAAASLSVQPSNHASAWMNLFLGIWVFISPWAIGFTFVPLAFWNSFLIGAAIVVFALLRMAAGRRVTTRPMA